MEIFKRMVSVKTWAWTSDWSWPNKVQRWETGERGQAGILRNRARKKCREVEKFL